MSIRAKILVLVSGLIAVFVLVLGLEIYDDFQSMVHDGAQYRAYAGRDCAQSYRQICE